MYFCSLFFSKTSTWLVLDESLGSAKISEFVVFLGNSDQFIVFLGGFNLVFFWLITQGNAEIIWSKFQNSIDWECYQTAKNTDDPLTGG